MTLRYICCRCDTRAESSAGHHLCEAPSNETLAAALEAADQPGWCVEEAGDGFDFLGWEAFSRGYRWTLSSVGDGTEYRATFERHLGNPAPSAIDRTPARAFARAWLRTIETAQRAAEDAA